MSIRPTVEFEGQDWFVEYDNEQLVLVGDAKKVRELSLMSRVQLEELSEALLAREEEHTELVQMVDSCLDVMDYEEKANDQKVPEVQYNSKWQ